MSQAGARSAQSHDLNADIVDIASIEAIPTILDVVCRTTGMGFAAVARVTEKRWVACAVRDDIAFGLQPGGELDVTTTICHEIRQSRTAVVINHVTEDEAYCGHPTPARYGFQSYISMPILMPDGTFFGTLCAIDPKPAQLSKPEVVGMFKMFADLIAFHLDAHRRLAASSVQRDRAWKNSRDLQVVVDERGIILAANQAWLSILGWEPDEVVGRSHLHFSHPEHEAANAAALATSVNEALLAYETRCLHKDGSARWISWVAAPEAGLIYGSGRDVTSEKAAAAEYLAVQEQLRQSQKLEAVGQLTGGVAHDFNNLLTIIRSSLEFLRRPDLPDERRKRYMDAASETVDRAAKLTGQLLAFARRQALKPEVFEVGRTLRGVAEMLDTVTGARIRIVTDLPERPCFVRADLSQFETALINMAVNARDAMDGSGTLTLRLVCTDAMPSIRGHGPAKGPFAVVSITDTGAGILPEQIGRIFEPFFTTKEVGKGTGLGLSQVFGFAKQSGGDVDVESTFGHGTRFMLYLPETEGEPQREHETENAAPTPVGSGQRVLVVEDNIEVGRFAAQILEDLGYVPIWAANAEEALDKLGTDGAAFDAVFSDVVMPGMGGIALARELRRRLPDLPVVLTSGYSHVLAEDDQHGFELRHKPYSADLLGRLLSRVARRPVKA